MTVNQLADQLEAIASRYVRDPVRQLDLQRELLRLVARHDMDVRQSHIDRVGEALRGAGMREAVGEQSVVRNLIGG